MDKSIPSESFWEENMTNITTEISDFELYEVPEEGEIESEPNDDKEGPVPTPPWRGELQAIELRGEDANRGEVDENGHRIILVDEEMFRVVEGDLLLDVDQKELWQEALNSRQTEF